MRHVLCILVTMVAAGALLLASGCGAPNIMRKPATEVPLSLLIQGGNALNPDARGRASPVFLRVYALRDAAGFSAADFDQLAADDESLLAAAIVYRELVTLRPGASRELNWALDSSVNALAAMAEFRDPYQGNWRTVLPVSVAPSRRTRTMRVELSVDGTSIQLMAAD